MMSGRTSAVVAGVCGALFVAYCIYFDRKRRSDPRFKEKLRERKCLEAEEREGEVGELVVVHVADGLQRHCLSKKS